MSTHLQWYTHFILYSVFELIGTTFEWRIPPCGNQKLNTGKNAVL